MGGVSGSSQASAQREASAIQAQAATQVAEIQSEAALQAADRIAVATEGAAELQLAASGSAIAEQRRQFDASSARLAPFTQLGLDSLDDVGEAATLEGFADRLSAIADTDIFQELIQDRFQSADNRLGQAGLNRSGAAGQQASDITADLALSLDSVLHGRQLNNLSVGQASAAGQANLGQNFANSAASIGTNAAAQAGGLSVQGAQAQAQGINDAAFQAGAGISGAANATAQGIVGAANAQAQGQSNLLNLGVSALFFSDERMKKNMKKVGNVCNLDLYRWEWKDKHKGLMGAEMTTGFKAQDVEREYPDCVVDIHGVKAVDYPKLYTKLETRLAA